jgi:hypothetical protein
MATLDNSQTWRRATMPEWLRQGESRLRLQTIVRLRWLAVLGQTLTVTGAYWVLGIDLPKHDLVVIDPKAAWTPTAASLRSLGKNTPLLGRALAGRVVAAVVDGELRLELALA